MNQTLRKDANQIVTASIRAVLPDEAVERALKAFSPRGGRTLLVAAGKAAWQMAYAAVAALGHVDGGVVVTKYDHIRGNIPGVDCYEAGHPVPDENGFAATGKALDLISDLSADDTVLFLLSGGGSALFEQPLLPGEELQTSPASAGLRRGHCRNKHHPQAAFTRKGWPIRRSLRPRTGVLGRTQRYFGRSTGYDRFRPRLPGQIHLRRSARCCRKIQAGVLGPGDGAAAAGRLRRFLPM